MPAILDTKILQQNASIAAVLNGSYTVPAGTTMLAIAAVCQGDASFTSITFAGKAAVFVQEIASGVVWNSRKIRLYMLAMPTIGVNAVISTLSQIRQQTLIISSWNDIDQATPFGNIDTYANALTAVIVVPAAALPYYTYMAGYADWIYTLAAPGAVVVQGNTDAWQAYGLGSQAIGTESRWTWGGAADDGVGIGFHPNAIGALPVGTPVKLKKAGVFANKPLRLRQGGLWISPVIRVMPVTLSPSIPAVAAGFTRVVSEDFAANAQPAGWTAYPYPYKDTMKSQDLAYGGYYHGFENTQFVGGQMVVTLKANAGAPLSTAVQPDPTRGITYGRYSFRLRTTNPSGIGWKIANLLWPDDDVWPAHGEIDWPEGNLPGAVGGFMHYAQPAGIEPHQDFRSSTASLIDTHNYMIEWLPGRVGFFVDGVLVGSYCTTLIPSTPMHWVIQCETSLDRVNPTGDAVLYFEWVTVDRWNG